MKAAAILLLLFSVLAAELPSIEITETHGFALSHCHPGDTAMVEVTPIPEGPQRVGGQFTTTKPILPLASLSMLPDGANLARVRTLCAQSGRTSVVSEILIILKRPIPPPKLRRERLIVDDGIRPPVPGGAPFPLPGSSNDTYKAFRSRLEQSAGANRRRSQ